MAKKDLDTVEPSALASPLRSLNLAPAKIEGHDDPNPFSRMAMCYGTPEESVKYGKHLQRGNFFDTLDSSLLGKESIDVVMLAGWIDWCRWEKGEDQPQYVYRAVADVPKEDLEWDEDEQGNRLPPLATKRANLIVAVRGVPYPFGITLKKTSFAAFEFMSKMDARAGCSRIYTLYGADDKNAAGQAYTRLSVKLAESQEVDDAMRQAVAVFKRGTAAIHAKAEKAAAKDDGWEQI